MTRNLQIVHEELAGHGTGGIGSLVDFATVDRYQQLGETALAVANAKVTRQAAMVAYIDDFYLRGWLCLLAVPLVLLTERSPCRPTPPDTSPS